MTSHKHQRYEILNVKTTLFVLIITYDYCVLLCVSGWRAVEMTSGCEQRFWSEKWPIYSWGTRSSPASLRRPSPLKTRWISSGQTRRHEASVSNPTSVLQSFITRVCVSGTRLTAWAAWRRWWTRTSASWRIWAICADRCDCWRRGTTSTCSAPASWRRSSAEPTPSARSSTPTRDRWADAERFPETCHLKRHIQTNEWWMFVFLRPTRWAPNTRQRPWRLRSGSLSTRTSTTNMRPFWRRERCKTDHSHHMRWNDNDCLTVALWMCVMQKLISERDTLRETTEELRCAQVQQQCLTGLTHTASQPDSMYQKQHKPRPLSLTLSSNQLCPWLCVFVDSLSGDSGAVGSLASEIMPTEFRWALASVHTSETLTRKYLLHYLQIIFSRNVIQKIFKYIKIDHFCMEMVYIFNIYKNYLFD